MRSYPSHPPPPPTAYGPGNSYFIIQILTLYASKKQTTKFTSAKVQNMIHPKVIKKKEKKKRKNKKKKKKNVRANSVDLDEVAQDLCCLQILLLSSLTLIGSYRVVIWTLS